MKILVCDDDGVIRYLLEMVLGRRGGHEVRAVEHPDLVGPLATEWQPDLVLLDFVLPGRTGMELVEDLRRDPDTRDVPVVFLTGRVDVAEDGELERLGVVAVIEKPFETSTLSERLSQLVA